MVTEEQQTDAEVLFGNPDRKPLDEPRQGHTAETTEQRERRCPFHKTCVCSHTECRDGWLDEDEPDPIPMDAFHVRSRRCPRCKDAMEMHTELQGMKGRR